VKNKLLLTPSAAKEIFCFSKNPKHHYHAHKSTGCYPEPHKLNLRWNLEFSRQKNVSNVFYDTSRRVICWNLCCLNIGVAGASDMFVLVDQVTRRHIPEERNNLTNPVHALKSCLGNILISFLKTVLLHFKACSYSLLQTSHLVTILQLCSKITN
jgi:hypothetical protein